MSGREDDEVSVIVTAHELMPDGTLLPIGEPRERTISVGALRLLHGEADPLADRRQRAREAFDDVWNSRPDDPYDGRGHDPQTWAERLQRAREEAIEAATRVKITEDITRAAQAWDGPVCDWQQALTAAFRAAGFEVEE